jgi:hypothetical protein
VEKMTQVKYIGGRGIFTAKANPSLNLYTFIGQELKTIKDEDIEYFKKHPLAFAVINDQPLKEVRYEKPKVDKPKVDKIKIDKGE